eukprot:741050-Rhodomonas_salina.1
MPPQPPPTPASVRPSSPPPPPRASVCSPASARLCVAGRTATRSCRRSGTWRRSWSTGGACWRGT